MYFKLFSFLPPPFHSNIHPKESKESTAGQRHLWPGDRVLLSTLPGIHQRPQSRGVHSGHAAAPQRAPHIHPGWVCGGAAPPPPWEAPQQAQRGEAGSSKDDGEQFSSKHTCGLVAYSPGFNAGPPLQLTKNGTQESAEAEQLTVDDIPEKDIDISGANLDEGSFLQPYTPKRRYALLKAAGVKKIDKEEKRQLHELRISRENCGCDCQGFCDPETCGCSLAGIKCQVRAASKRERLQNHKAFIVFFYFLIGLNEALLLTDGPFLLPLWLHEGRLW